MIRQNDLQEPIGAELSVVHAGMEQCAPGHAFGPAVRDYYLFHFVASGKGIFQSGGRCHQVLPRQGFMIFPDQVSYYEADRSDPWHYTWIAFSGRRAAAFVHQAGLSLQTPVTPPAEQAESTGLWTQADCFQQISRCLSLQNGREQRLLGLLYLFLAELTAQNPSAQADADQVHRKEHYVRLAKDYMEMNYAHKIIIADLAAHIGLDRSYFGQLFRAGTGLTPQQYLLRLRMDKACRLMSQSDLAIGTVARSVGYEDPLLFSRMFRRVIGYPPSMHRRRQEDNLKDKRMEDRSHEYTCC